jgi:hypothetical protein
MVRIGLATGVPARENAEFAVPAVARGSEEVKVASGMRQL